MSKQYVRFLVRRYRSLIVFFFAVYLLVSLLFAQPNEPMNRFYDISAAAGILAVCACYVLPVVLFSFVHRRSSADVYHALPIKRSHHRCSILFFSFAVIFGYYLITVLFGWLLYGIGNVSVMFLLTVLLYEAFMITVLLHVNSALYLLGNNVLDGIVILAAYTMFVLPCFLAASLITERMIAGVDSLRYGQLSMCLSPAYVLLHNYIVLVSNHRLLSTDINYMYLLLGVLYGLLGRFGMKKEFDERNSERAEAISDHPFAYPAVINLYAAVMLGVIASSAIADRGTDSLAAYLAILVCYIAGTFLYRRKIELDVKRIALFAAEAVSILLLMWVCWKTRGFGAAERYELNRGYVLCYEYSASVNEENLGEPYTGEQEANVQFSIYFSTNELDRYREVIDILEQNRHRAIDSFYRRYAGWSAYLRAYNREKASDRIINDYNYRPEVLLSEEELKTISRYTEVTVSDYGNYEHWQGNDVSLEEYLAYRDRS